MQQRHMHYTSKFRIAAFAAIVFSITLGSSTWAADQRIAEDALAKSGRPADLLSFHSQTDPAFAQACSTILDALNKPGTPSYSPKKALFQTPFSISWNAERSDEKGLNVLGDTLASARLHARSSSRSFDVLLVTSLFDEVLIDRLFVFEESIDAVRDDDGRINLRMLSAATKRGAESKIHRLRTHDLWASESGARTHEERDNIVGLIDNFSWIDVAMVDGEPFALLTPNISFADGLVQGWLEVFVFHLTSTANFHLACQFRQTGY